MVYSAVNVAKANFIFVSLLSGEGNIEMEGMCVSDAIFPELIFKTTGDNLMKLCILIQDDVKNCSAQEC